MAEKKVDESPFLQKMENFEIADGKNKKGPRGEVKNVYRSLDNEFNFENEEVTPEGEKPAVVNEPVVNEHGVNEPDVNEPAARQTGKSDANIRTIKINRKNLKKLFSSQFFTQTLTDDSSTNSISELKMSKRYATGEFFKALFLFTLFLTTSYFAFFYIYKNYFGKSHLCGNLDLYNYKYENQVRFVPSVSGAGHYVFTGKFPFDVITHKVRKEALKESMNEELEKYNQENPQKNPLEKIKDLDEHPIQILSFLKHNNKMKCEKNIFDLYRPFYLKSTNVDISQKNFILSEVNYSFITNPYSVPEGKLYAEVANLMKKSEAKNKICYMTSYLNSLRGDKGMDVGRVLSEGSAPTPNTEQTTENEVPSSEVPNKATEIITAAVEGAKKFLKGTPSIGEEQVLQKKANELGGGGYFSGMLQPPKRKIVYLYDYYGQFFFLFFHLVHLPIIHADNNFVDLLVAIYNMQYGNAFSDFKTYWEDLKRKFKVISPEEIYLLEWYCLGVNYNLIENNNHFKLNCVDLLK
ncbi:Uncharacterized protein PCOAH_00011590 [Plasmodium coatneyi]|uniref:Uncharacterized protein n=1 Tax=Plasmodium coatneyi TaxID=208452 RepID=A0A1B1DVW6_9APIC|nr:Uncharacterized protein PCOAH_00011590 [Plasmodium coatneyi]ANQ06908.1 Uncharacterized protein PCOAH_00011590 [Plasmodium coatneyi]